MAAAYQQVFGLKTIPASKWLREFKCGAKVSVGLAGGFGRLVVEDLTDGGVAAARGVQCRPVDLVRTSLEVQGEGEVDCRFEANPRPALFAGATGKLTTQLRVEAQLAADGGSCYGFSSTIGLEAEVETGFSFGWLEVGGQCKASASYCSEARSCGVCSCKNCLDSKTEWKCKALTAGRGELKSGKGAP